ncbi:hypothetical protein DPMN_154514 [Dreissena polymorpha]|uniref:Uncharacterized protein n=1 Tax=Dreissena polymorpha TaxID=45954 RepID=A0A9D4B5R5_DREPO|nr:hypothetical protein DPMN_192141 [Dreissena polymorpha]KAH3800871.1 hypothetical protein DPMN_154514 [Dreissena polymorpha]
MGFMLNAKSAAADQQANLQRRYERLLHKLVRLSESLTESLCNVKELARLYESLWMPIGYVYELAIESCDFERHQATPLQYESRSEKTGHNACASIVVPD